MAKKEPLRGKRIVTFAISGMVFFLACMLLLEITNLREALIPQGLYHIKSDVFSVLRFERVLCIAGYVIIVSVGMFYGFRRLSLSEPVKNIVLLIHTIICTLLLLEGIFMFVPKSGGDDQFSQIVWMNKYWRVYVPVFDLRNNPMNLREIPATTKSRADAGPTAFVVGDSFGAGDGIDDPDSIFSSVIYHKITSRGKPEWQMVNICERGDGPAREYDNMINYSLGSNIVPNVVIWQYYGNDIEEVGQRHGRHFDYKSSSGLSDFGDKYFKGKSFLTDYIYWNSFYRGPDHEYLAYLEGLYGDTSCMNDHIKPVLMASRWCNEHHAGFVVVVFPLLTNTDWSKKVYTIPVTNLLAGMNVQSIDLSDSLKNIPIAERIVNNRNTHPSVTVHKRVGQIVYDFISAAGSGK